MKTESRARFSLRDASADDGEFMLALFALPHVREFVMGPRSREHFLDVLRERELRDDRSMLVVERDERPFGTVNVDVHDGWLMELRTIAFEEQRCGAGTFVMRRLIEHGFANLGVHRIYLEVMEDNTAARTLYERLGFQSEGCFRDGFRAKDGTFKNLIPYGLLHSSAWRAEMTR